MRSMLTLLALLPWAISPSFAGVISGKHDAAPAGYEGWVSPVVVPAPNVTGQEDRANAVSKVKELVK
jgi:beta-glucosidase